MSLLMVDLAFLDRREDQERGEILALMVFMEYLVHLDLLVYLLSLRILSWKRSVSRIVKRPEDRQQLRFSDQSSSRHKWDRLVHEVHLDSRGALVSKVMQDCEESTESRD